MNARFLSGGLLMTGLLAAATIAAVYTDGPTESCPGVCCPPSECRIVECEQTEDGCLAVVEMTCEGEDGGREVCRVRCEEADGVCNVVSCEPVGEGAECAGGTGEACGSACAPACVPVCATACVSTPAPVVSGPFSTLLAFLSAGARPSVESPAQAYSPSITARQSATLLH